MVTWLRIAHRHEIKSRKDFYFTPQRETVSIEVPLYPARMLEYEGFDRLFALSGKI
jgi:hypothetical protein